MSTQWNVVFNDDGVVIPVATSWAGADDCRSGLVRLFQWKTPITGVLVDELLARGMVQIRDEYGSTWDAEQFAGVLRDSIQSFEHTGGVT